MAESHLWVLSLQAAGVVTSVLVNDVTVCEKRFDAATSFGEKINPLLVAGENSVTVSLGLPAAAGRRVPLPPKSDRFPPDPPGTPSFAMKVQRGTQGTDPGQDGILARYEWTPGQPPLAAGPPPVVAERTFVVESLPWPAPAWSVLPPLRLDRPALDSFVRSYADMLRKPAIEEVVDLNKLKFQQLARSLDLDEAAMAEGLRGYLRSLSAEPDWAVSIAPDLRYTLEGRSRLVRVAGPDGGAPIHAVSAGRTTPFDLTVCILEGGWRIVR